MNEKENISLNISDFNLEEPLVEMARINLKEEGKNAIFPYNKFEVRIWSNDHNPPHFHVRSEGWEILFTIDTGKLLEIKKKGKNQSVYRYICTHVDEWLNSKCFFMPKLTNKENAEIAWAQIHNEGKTLHEKILISIARAIEETLNE